MARDLTWWTDQLTAARAQVVAINAALLAFASDGTIEEYRLDTGQTDNRVRRADVDRLARVRDKLLITIDTLEVKVGQGGCGVTRIIPSW